MSKWERFWQVWKLVEQIVYQRPEEITRMERHARAAFLRYLKVVGEE